MLRVRRHAIHRANPYTRRQGVKRIRSSRSLSTIRSYRKPSMRFGRKLTKFGRSLRSRVTKRRLLKAAKSRGFLTRKPKINRIYKQIVPRANYTPVQIAYICRNIPYDSHSWIWGPQVAATDATSGRTQIPGNTGVPAGFGSYSFMNAYLWAGATVGQAAYARKYSVIDQRVVYKIRNASNANVWLRINIMAPKSKIIANNSLPSWTSYDNSFMTCISDCSQNADYTGGVRPAAHSFMQPHFQWWRLWAVRQSFNILHFGKRFLLKPGQTITKVLRYADSTYSASQFYQFRYNTWLADRRAKFLFFTAEPEMAYQAGASASMAPVQAEVQTTVEYFFKFALLPIPTP